LPATDATIASNACAAALTVASPSYLPSAHTFSALEATRYVDPTTFADVELALGETTDALRLYDQALADRSPSMAHALVLPRILPALAHEPRFDAILGAMRFPTTSK
jgi:hypothetical protein